ncbi:MAG TPA: histidine phosphatase family protein [Acidimicrobiales bacterium]|nr:histidine phosphatase family protein [Acidimicrobiales bacterium]
MELLLIRHALPERIEAAEGRADPNLSPKGEQQAELLGEWLSSEHIDAIYASPMARAAQTAAAVCAHHGHDVITETGVIEFDSGANSYIPYEEMDTTSEEFRAMVTGAWASLGGPDPGPFRSTVVESIERIATDHPSQTVAIVCHAGVINAYMAHLLGIDRPLFFNPYYTSINRVLASSKGPRMVQSLNETAHLRGTSL